MTQQITGKEVWENTKELLGSYQVVFGRQGSDILFNDPKKMGGLLSRYKFAAKMACKTGKALELSCGEGLGASILGETTEYTGVDANGEAIERAKRNFPKYTFLKDDYLGKKYGLFDAVVSLNPQSSPLFFQTLIQNLSPNGVAVLCGSKALIAEMKALFHQVFIFGISDEIVHTGPSEDIICVGCHAKR